MEFKSTIDIISHKKALRLLYRKRLTISIIGDIFVILFGVGTIVYSQLNKDYFFYLGLIMLVLGSIGLITSIVKINKDINLTIKQMQQRFEGDSCDFLFTFNEEAIINKNLKSENYITMKYNEFKICIENNEIILLITKLKQFIFIAKDSINDIESDNIINFLKDKKIAYKRVK